MKFTTLLKSVILENSRFKILYDNLVPKKEEKGKKSDPKKLPFDILKKIIAADPDSKFPQGFDFDTATPEDMEKGKVGKYTNWLIKNFMKPSASSIDADPSDERAYGIAVKNYKDLFLEDLYKTTNDLKKFERFKNQLAADKRDIMKLSPSELFDLVKDFSLEKTKATKSEKETAKKTYEHPGGKVAFRGPNWTVIKIEGTGELQKDAACFYGGSHEYDKGESRWCTSSPGMSYWKNYLSRGPLYVILPNESSDVGKVSGLPVERYQFQFPDAQFMDRHDRQIDLVGMLNGKLSEVKEYFKPEFAKGLMKSNENKAVITYPDSASGKFVALYGFEELFNSFPESLESLVIENKSRDNVALDVPSSIGKFKNLTTLMLQNIVRTLPEEIGQLTKLDFLSLPDNKELKELPNSIVNLDNMTFINLRGSNPDIKIPEGITEKYEDLGGGFWYTA